MVSYPTQLSRFTLLCWFCALGLPLASGALSDDARKMLVDNGGWEYITLSDAQNGFPTVHTCFDGTPHENECSGKLILTPAMTFQQTLKIRGQTVERRGSYEMSGDQISFFDEMGTKDGPYTISIDTAAKKLKLSMPQVNVELMLDKEYRQRRKSASQKRN